MSGVSFPIKLQASGKKKGTQTQKEIPTQMFSAEFFEIFKKHIFNRVAPRACFRDASVSTPKITENLAEFYHCDGEEVTKVNLWCSCSCREHSKKLTRTMVFLWCSRAGFLWNNCKRLPDKCSDLNCVVSYFREKWMTLKSCMQQFVFDRIIYISNR